MNNLISLSNVGSQQKSNKNYAINVNNTEFSYTGEAKSMNKYN